MIYRYNATLINRIIVAKYLFIYRNLIWMYKRLSFKIKKLTINLPKCSFVLNDSDRPNKTPPLSEGCLPLVPPASVWGAGSLDWPPMNVSKNITNKFIKENPGLILKSTY